MTVYYIQQETRQNSQLDMDMHIWLGEHILRGGGLIIQGFGKQCIELGGLGRSVGSVETIGNCQ